MPYMCGLLQTPEEGWGGVALTWKDVLPMAITVGARGASRNKLECEDTRRYVQYSSWL